MNNNAAYNIVAENELSIILSHYSTEFVISVVEEAFNRRKTEFPIMQMPNIVAAWESNFNMIISDYIDYPQAREEVIAVRNNTYREIINSICKEFNLNFTIDDVDLYTAAYNMYDFFVCSYASHLVNFICNFIFREKASLYEAMSLSEYKKNKDSGTIYGKKLFKDVRLAIINANLNKVIDYISVMDIPLYNIFATNPNTFMANYMNSIVSTEGDFFKNFYMQTINSHLRADYLTAIRLLLHSMNVTNESYSSITEGE